MWITKDIFHEKQDARLCAQHCLNAALQGPYFTAVDLSKIAQDLDDEERIRMSENGQDSTEYRDFINQPSGNMDDTGYFSIQVITRALETFSLELIPLNSTDTLAQRARNDPSTVQAFIFNIESHWYCVRRFHSVFFNLNSLLNKPKYIGALYLTEYFRQMKDEGYSIFIVNGIFPDCPSDTSPPYFEKAFVEPINIESTDSDEDLQRAIQLSLTCESGGSTSGSTELDKSFESCSSTELEKAVEMSLECFADTRSKENALDNPIDETQVCKLREKRLAYFQKK